MAVKRAVDLMNAEIPQNTFWLEPRILPFGGRFVIAAETKLGKSFVSLSLAAGLTHGGAILGERTGITAPHACRILLVDTELGEHRLQENFRHVLYGKETLISDRFFYVSKEPDLFLDTAEGMRRLNAYVQDCKPNVVILDPIGKFMANMDENSPRDMNVLSNSIDKLLAVGKAWGMAAIITHHTRKASHDSRGNKVSDDLDIDNITGASKWKNYADAILMLGHKEVRARNPHYWWTLGGRWTLRHGPEPPDLVISINRDNDRKVKYFGGASAAPAVPAAPALSPLPSSKGKT